MTHPGGWKSCFNKVNYCRKIPSLLLWFPATLKFTACYAKNTQIWPVRAFSPATYTMNVNTLLVENKKCTY